MNYLYKLKRIGLKPYVWYMRKQEPHHTGFWRAALELHSYSKALRSFAVYRNQHPDMLVDYPVQNTSIVIDLGGYEGQWADELLHQGEPKELHIYEPLPGLVKRLRKKYEDQKQIFIHQFGASDTNHKTDFFLAAMGSSAFQEGKGATQASKKIQVQMRDIAEIIQEKKQIAILKINIEGGEYPVLERLIETGLINQIDCVYVQFHEWITKSYSRRRKIHRALRQSHQCEWNYYFVWEKWTKKK